MESQEERQLRIVFSGIYTPGRWRRIFRYVIKLSLKQEEVVRLFEGDISEQAIKRWFKKLKQMDQYVVSRPKRSK